MSEQDEKFLAPFKADVAVHALRMVGFAFTDPTKAAEEARELELARAEHDRAAAFLKFAHAVQRDR